MNGAAWIAYGAGVASVGAWIYLLCFRGGFWRVRELPDPPRAEAEPSVAAVAPARNEEAVVALAMESLAGQNYTGRFNVFLVDDHSADATIQAAGTHPRLRIVQAGPMPPGWTGKLWAVSEGLKHAERLQPDYILLTDADIVHSPDSLSRLVARAQAENLDLVSWMAALRCNALAERALVPAFVFFFFMLYPPAWVANPRRGIAAAAGGCMLVRRSALERIGGIAAIRGELIDDCALARAIKPGGRIWLGITDSVRSIRVYDTFAEIGRMISRSAFTQLRHSALLLAGTVIGLAIVFVAPPLLFLSRDPSAVALGVIAWALMTMSYLPMLRFYRRSPCWAPLLPLSALFYIGATLHSALRYWSGQGGEWKGRFQDDRP